MLGIGGFSEFGDNDLEALSSLLHLDHLGIGGTSVTSVGLEKLGRHCPHLKWLNAHKLEIRGTAESLRECVSGLPKLRGVDFAECFRTPVNHSERLDMDMVALTAHLFTNMELCRELSATIEMLYHKYPYSLCNEQTIQVS